MDPTANLEEQRELAADALSIQDGCSDQGEYTDEQEKRLAEIATRQAELFQALDAWIIGGGFLPEAWRQA
jgi:hypothetical protein